MSLTTWVVTGSQQNTTSGLALANEVAGSWSTQDSVLSDQELLHAVCRADLGNCLDDFWVVIATIATNDEECSLRAFGDGEEDAGNEGFRVVGLLEDDDLFTETRTNSDDNFQ